MKFKTNVMWRWYAGKDLPSQTVQLYLMGDGAHGEVFQKRFEKVTVDEYQAGTVSEHGPTMSLEFEEAQFLMDQLFDAGIKPHNMGPSMGQVKAMQDHIDSLKAVIDQITAEPAPPLVMGFSQKAAEIEDLLVKKG